MNVRIMHLVEGARAATGIAVIIDVFRAFSVEAYIMNRGVEKLIPVGDMQFAYNYKEKHPSSTILIGERKGIMLPGFDFGNSPSQIADEDFRGKTVIHTTSAGTQGIANAINADEIITGSLVNAAAIAKYILNSGYEDVCLVAMGLQSEKQTPEDNLCAEYIKSILEGSPIELGAAIDDLKLTSGAKFFNPEKNKDFPTADFSLCTDVDKFNFVLKVLKDKDGLNYIKRIDV